MISPEPTQLTHGEREVRTSKRKRGWRREGACLGKRILAGFLGEVAGRADGVLSHGGRSLQPIRRVRGGIQWSRRLEGCRGSTAGGEVSNARPRALGFVSQPRELGRAVGLTWG